jgi:hypothetical protein
VGSQLVSGYYGVLLPSYFTGTTGCAIRKRGGKDAQLLGAFLIANEWMNMLGLYKLRLIDVRDVLKLTPAAALRAYEVMAAEQYAFYDADTSFVWVKEMARIRLGLKDERPLSPKDNKSIGAERLYRGLHPNPFLGAFFDRYGKQLHLKSRREGPSLDMVYRRGFEGASKGLRRGFEGASKPGSGSGSETGSGTGTSERLKAAPREERAPLPARRSLHELAERALELEGADQPIEHLTEVVRGLCDLEPLPGVSRSAIVAELSNVLAEHRHG